MKKVIVIGLAKSGIAAARLLADKGEEVFISEIKISLVTELSLNNLIEEGVVKRENSELGSHTEDLIKKCDLMVVSPGVKNDSLAIKIAEKNNIPIISEVELAYSMCETPIIAVTGTSGKTTVTTLIGEMLKASGKDAIVCGNIGNPFSGEISRIKRNSVVILEISSFQLMRTKTFRPKIALILNISTNHLDWHKDMEEYMAAKFRIFANQKKEDMLFINSSDNNLKKLSEKDLKTRVEFFDKFKDFRKRLGINNENYLASMSAASIEGVSEDIMLKVISGFKGIEHRLEHVANINGVDFINDSKSTTVSSVEWALKSLEGRIFLIMGGKYKGGDFGRLKDFIENKVDRVIAIGEARPEIKKAISSFKDVLEENSLEDAVNRAFKEARKGDKILLSPGCSSFDMFNNYEERGRIFKDISLSYEKRRA